ncbi:MAG: hypothetical protein U1E81_18585 [Xanthobacteraceae bacterium]
MATGEGRRPSAVCREFSDEAGKISPSKVRLAKYDQRDGSQAIPVGVVVRPFFVHYFKASFPIKPAARNNAMSIESPRCRA